MDLGLTVVYIGMMVMGSMTLWIVTRGMFP